MAWIAAERMRWVQLLGRGIREHGFGIGSSNEPIIRKPGELSANQFKMSTLASEVAAENVAGPLQLLM